LESVASRRGTRCPIIPVGEEVGMAVKVLPLGIKEIEMRLGSYEDKFGQPSDSFVEAFRNGKLEETPEFDHWALLIAARDLLKKRGA
jgi:hypothetical protein